jgi:hypothetical protein
MAPKAAIPSARITRPDPSGPAARAFLDLDLLLVLRTPGSSAGGSGVAVA